MKSNTFISFSLENKAKAEFPEKPHLVAPVIEMSMANSLIPKFLHSQESKDLWKSFGQKTFHKVSFVLKFINFRMGKTKVNLIRSLK